MYLVWRSVFWLKIVKSNIIKWGIYLNNGSDFYLKWRFACDQAASFLFSGKNKQTNKQTNNKEKQKNKQKTKTEKRRQQRQQLQQKTCYDSCLSLPCCDRVISCGNEEAVSLILGPVSGQSSR